MVTWCTSQDKEEENHYLKLHGQPIIIHNANQPYVTNADATIKFRKTEDKDDIGVQVSFLTTVDIVLLICVNSTQTAKKEK